MKNNPTFFDDLITNVLCRIGIDSVSIFTYDFQSNGFVLDLTSDEAVEVNLCNNKQNVNNYLLSVYGIDYLFLETKILVLPNSKYINYSFSTKKENVIHYYELLATTNKEKLQICILDVSTIENYKLRLKDMELKQELKTKYISDLLHEIRTPVNAILGFSELMTEKIYSNELFEYRSVIQENALLLTFLIKEHLDCSTMEYQPIRLNIEPVSIKDICKEVYLTNKINFNQEVSLFFDSPLQNVILLSDRNRLFQVLNNFISNALKFTPKGKVVLSYRLIDENQIMVFVSDTGIGIPSEKVEEVFNRYVKLDQITSGYGLGLSICKKIIQALGGEIGVESEIGIGSTFWFKLKILQ